MELGARELMTIGTVLCGLAATWGMLRSQLARGQEDIKGIQDELESLNARLDTAESNSVLYDHQIKILGGILSPNDLRDQHKLMANIEARLSVAEERIRANSSMHNGTHPATGARDG